ncbi:hypothetical protein KIN20_005697 [Parelaphostrongylus tenuis]|uniref:Poly(A) RNA polymerase mitochondrial-like central palm domain-containing protein n=1 Tax=Parelaphostrongylus tenuis TaxID=148309 RepID=A0AAD5MJ44_PARTN|nr:hypothetical protein KIN20_005697 [Parelaphostrongylus tenuis]
MSKEDDLVIVEECKRYAEKYMVEQNIAAIKQFRKYYSSHFADPRYAEEFRMLSDEIFRRFQRNRQTSAEFRRKMVMIDEIGKVIQKNQSWRFKLFPSGSTMTGLATKGSDLDVTIWCPDANRLFSNESEKEVCMKILKSTVVMAPWPSGCDARGGTRGRNPSA